MNHRALPIILLFSLFSILHTTAKVKAAPSHVTGRRLRATAPEQRELIEFTINEAHAKRLNTTTTTHNRMDNLRRTRGMIEATALSQTTNYSPLTFEAELEQYDTTEMEDANQGI